MPTDTDLTHLKTQLEAAFAAIATGQDKPQTAPIDTFHRGHDGFISFLNKKDGSTDAKHVVNIRADALGTMFPHFANELSKDSFYSVNGFAAPRNARDQSMTHAKVYSSNMLRYLCASYVDLDIYNGHLKPGAAIGQVIDAQLDGKIPAPTAFAVSGRGLWLYWALKDPEKPDHPQRAWPEKNALYLQVQNAIRKAFTGLSADPNTPPLTQITRVPGSINTKSNTPVHYQFQTDRNGKLPAYTLNELANWFNVKPKHALNAPRVRNPNKRIGWLALSRARLEQFEILRAMRGGFKIGTRDCALRLYALLLVSNDIHPYEAQKKLFELFDEFQQGTGTEAFDRSQVMRALTNAKLNKKRRWRDVDIANGLRITPDESELLAQTFRKPWPPEEKYGVVRVTQDVDREQRVSPTVGRRKALVEIHAQNHKATLRERVELLAAWGIEAAPATVMRDMEALGLKTPEQQEKAEREALLRAQECLKIEPPKGLVSSTLHNTSTYYVESLRDASHKRRH